MMPRKKAAKSHDARGREFIETLASACYVDEERRDRAALAALKRGLSGEQRDLAQVYPHVLRHMHGVSDRHQDAYIQTACLYGLHPTPLGVLTSGRGGVSLARGLRRVWDAHDRQGSIQPRFMALLQSHQDDVVGHLRQAVSLIAGHEQVIHLRWSDVLSALQWWSNPKGFAQRRWANDFWGAAGDPNDEEGGSR